MDLLEGLCQWWETVPDLRIVPVVDGNCINASRDDRHSRERHRRDGVYGHPRGSDEGDDGFRNALLQIGRASCRERVCQYVSISVVDVSLKNQTTSILR